VHQRGALGELLGEPVERVSRGCPVGGAAGGLVQPGDHRGQVHDRAVAQLEQVGPAGGDERGQRVAHDVAQERLLPVPERAPAEQPVLHPAPPAVVGAVQHQQAVGHHHPAGVVERLFQVVLAERLAHVGVAVQGDRLHRRSR
jgi:hypothetical protein